MIETVAEYNTFWLIIFSAITIIAVGGILDIVIIKLKNKDTDIFFKSSDNAKDVTIDTTDKLSKAHTEVVEAKWDNAHEKEMHDIEDKLRNIEKQMQEISDMLTDITNRVIALEKKK